MDLSLDDIIKKSRRGGSSGRARGTRGGARKNSTGRAALSPGSRQRGTGRSRGGTGFSSRNQQPAQQYKRGNVDDRWSHDMYQTERSTQPRRTSAGTTTGSGLTKLMVSNLDFGVTDADIQELFGEFGPIRQAAVHYDRSGRSLGTAYVLFERRNDALKAMKQYGGVPLDGRAMKLELATSQTGEGLQQPRRPTEPMRGSGGAAGRMQRSGGTRGSRGAGGGRRGGNRGGGRVKTKQPTVEELDAELDAYINSAK